MTVELQFDQTLDCRGLLCPVPLIQLRRAIDSIKPDQILKVLCTDPGSKRDFPAFSKNTGHELLETREEGGIFTFYFRKVG